MAQWLWRLQSDTLGLSPAVASISRFSFLYEQVDFQRNIYLLIIVFLDFTYVCVVLYTYMYFYIVCYCAKFSCKSYTQLIMLIKYIFDAF